MTDVQMAGAPLREEVYVRQPYEQPAAVGVGAAGGSSFDRANIEAAELAAFEKGRMQGEMEAIRRAEAEAPLKTMGPTPAQLEQQAALLNTPDVIEINRLTWLQRAAWVLGEMSSLAMIILTIVWVEQYRTDWSWTNSQGNGDAGMLNAGLLAFALGLWFNAQAISNYRALPLNTSAHLNRAWYCIAQLCAITCYTVTLAALIMTSPTGETTFWRVDNWCFIFAYAVYVFHAFYSMARACLDAGVPVTYETWAEVNNNLDTHHHRRNRWSLFRGKGRADAGPTGRDAIAGTNDRRTLYTPAPVSLLKGRNTLPAANANVGAQVPVAPGNAPRWAENPRTHANDYFLLARAKWANVAFWAMGASFLMLLAAQQQLAAAGRGNWAQGGAPIGEGIINEDGTSAHVSGALGLLTLAMLVFISYASMPPRTTLVKNGIAYADMSRRPSISHNAETIV